MDFKGDPKIRVETVIKTLTYLAGLIGFSSVFRHISIVYSLTFLFVYLLSIYLDYKKGFFIPRWVLNIASLAVIVFSFMRIDLDDPVPPMLEGLLILLAIKSLEEKKFRDYMQIYAINVFLLSGSALMTIDLTFLAYFLSLIFILTTAIVLLTYYTHDHDLEFRKSVVYKIVSRSLMIPLISIPLTAMMFVVLPRTSLPLLTSLNRGEKARTGFTENVKLGDVSAIQEDTGIIFRANMIRTDDNSLYWRGIVMEYFDGRSWRALERTGTGVLSDLRGKRIKQTIYLEPYGNRYLLSLDKPVSISQKNLKIHKDSTLSLSDNIERRVKYDVFSVASVTIHEEGIDNDIYLQLPEEISPEMRALAKRLSSGKNKRETIEAFLNFFLGEGRFKYSLENLPVSKRPLEDFLFRYRHGNCEYFASAMAVMLRIAGIPARVVGGYKGGYYNNVGGYYLVPQKNAHVWVEAYLENGDWIRVDPTPVSFKNFTFPSERASIFKLRLLLDAINYYWNVMVINYDFNKQISLFVKLSLTIRKPRINLSLDKTDISRFITILAIGFFIAFLAYLLFLKRRPYEEKIIKRFLGKVERHGYKKGKSEGLEEFVSRIQDVELKEKAQKFVAEFERLYYKDKKLSKGDAKNLKEII